MPNDNDSASYEVPYAFFTYYGQDLTLAKAMTAMRCYVRDGYVVQRGTMHVPRINHDVIAYIHQTPSGEEELIVSLGLARDLYEDLQHDNRFREVEAVYACFCYCGNDKLGQVLRKLECHVETCGIHILYREPDFLSNKLRSRLRAQVGFAIIEHGQTPWLYLNQLVDLTFFHRVSHDPDFARLLQSVEVLDIFEESELGEPGAVNVSWDSGDLEGDCPPARHSQDPESGVSATVRTGDVVNEPTEVDLSLLDEVVDGNDNTANEFIVVAELEDDCGSKMREGQRPLQNTTDIDLVGGVFEPSLEEIEETGDLGEIDELIASVTKGEESAGHGKKKEETDKESG